MKTQIIALETHDDVISVRDRLSWAKAPRILLVWPKYEQVRLRAVDLRVLQQHASGLGAQLGLVTRRPDVRRDAQALAIPVFESASAAQRDAWPARRPPAISGRHRPRLDRLRRMRAELQFSDAAWRAHPAARVGSFALGVMAVLTILALFVPSATVTLQPASQLQSVIIPIAASPETQSVYVTGSLPARQTTVIVDGTQSLTVTSRGAIPRSKAHGVARFKNLTSAEVLIPSGTVLYSRGTAPVRFATTNEVRLPAGVNAFVEVPVEALEGGSTGNLPADSIQGVEGSLGLSVAVTNPNQTDGGSDRDAVAASEADRERARSLLIPSLEALARGQIGGTVVGAGIILPNTLKLSRVLAETYDPPAGQPGGVLNLTMQVEFAAQYVSGDDLAQLAGAALAPSIPPGFSAVPGSLTFQAFSTPASDGTGTTHFNLQAQRRLVRQIEPLRVAALTRGLPRRAVVSVLEGELPLEAPPEIELRPAWWPWMPLIPFRIRVETP